MKTNFSRILFYIRPYIKKYRLSFFLVFAGYTVGIFFDSLVKPYIYKEIIDSLSSGGSPDLILSHTLELVVVLGVSIILHNIGYRTGDYANSYFQSKLMKELNNNTFKRLLKHSYYFFSNNFSGSIVAKAKRFTKSFETLADVVSYQIYFSFVVLLGTIIILLIKAPLLAYIFIVWSLLYIFITILFIKKKIIYDIQEAESDSVVTASLSDAILNVLNVKIFRGDKKEENNYEIVTKHEEEKRRKAWYYGNFQNAIQAFLMAVLQIVILFTALHLWHKGLLSLGMIVLLQMYMFHLFDILWSLGKSLTKAIKSMTDMQEMVDIFDLPVEIKDPENPKKLDITNGNIIFNKMSFVYEGGVSVFNDLALNIKPGERIGLVGHSGAGKSTITKLLLRFADVSDGSITIDGQDIRSITQDDLRSVISYVPQESILFHRTIKENISYGKPDARDEEIIEVAKKAHAHEFISKLPNGYNTLVGERGVKLSGGERQRVAIARAMLKQAPILVLDEATSSLDSISEQYIQEAFNELMKGKTTIVIAHRLSTIQKMDRIIVLEEGKIVEEGTHAKLIKKNGYYADLWNHQVGGFIE